MTGQQPLTLPTLPLPPPPLWRLENYFYFLNVVYEFFRHVFVCLSAIIDFNFPRRSSKSLITHPPLFFEVRFGTLIYFDFISRRDCRLFSSVVFRRLVSRHAAETFRVGDFCRRPSVWRHFLHAVPVWACVRIETRLRPIYFKSVVERKIRGRVFILSPLLLFLPSSNIFLLL